MTAPKSVAENMLWGGRFTREPPTLVSVQLNLPLPPVIYSPLTILLRGPRPPHGPIQPIPPLRPHPMEPGHRRVDRLRARQRKDRHSER